MTDPIYEAHRAKHVEAYNYHPDREPQGHSIEEVKAYAAVHIEEENAGRMRFSSISEVDMLCDIIVSKEGNKLLSSKLHAAFRTMGYNVRYSDMKNGNPDVMYTLGDTSHRCIMTYNSDVIKFATMDYRLFSQAYSTTRRVPKDTISVAKKDAKKCQVPLATLNLYNILSGIEVFYENDPHYFEAKAVWIVDRCLDVLRRTRTVLKFKEIGLRAILEYVGE